MPLDEELIALRREIHRRPELAGEERETAGLVAEHLRAAGLEVTTGVGGHGVVAVLDGSADGPTVAYRADMDAVDATRNVLPFPRSGRVHDEGFASRVPGVAHLCGHDLHTAIGVGVARTLARSSDQARGRLVFVFQPAEEPLRDARAMLDTGLVQELAPREFYALHCSPYPTGTIAVSPGYGLPGLDQVRIVVPGARRRRPASRPGSRGSARSGFRRTSPRTERTSTRCWTPTWPRTARNPCRSPRGPSRGPAGSRPSASCCASGRRSGCRTYARVERLAAAAGGHVTFQDAPFPALVNSPELSTAAGTYLSTTLGPESVLWARASWPYNCEDFALFLNEAPGAQLYLGVANTDAGIDGAPHSPEFAADERAIGHGVRATTGLLTHRLTALERTGRPSPGRRKGADRP